MKNLTLKQIENLIGKKVYVVKDFLADEEKFIFLERKISSFGVNDFKQVIIVASNEYNKDDFVIYRDLDEMFFTKKEAVEEYVNQQCVLNATLCRTASKEYKVDLCKLQAK